MRMGRRMLATCCAGIGLLALGACADGATDLPLEFGSIELTQVIPVDTAVAGGGELDTLSTGGTQHECPPADDVPGETAPGQSPGQTGGLGDGPGCEEFRIQ